MVQKEKGFRSFSAGWDESCLCVENLWYWGHWLSSYPCVQAHLSVYIRLKMGYCKCKYGMARSFFLQFKLEKLRFSCFLKDAFCTKIKWHFYKSPGMLLWVTVSPPLHYWAAWAKPRSLPRCGWILVVLCGSWFTLGSFRGEGAVSVQKSTGVLTKINLCSWGNRDLKVLWALKLWFGKYWS